MFELKFGTPVLFFCPAKKILRLIDDYLFWKQKPVWEIDGERERARQTIFLFQ